MSRLAAIVAIGALAAAGAAHAQGAGPSTLSMFRSICVDTDAAPGEGLAKAPGWAELDAQTAPRFEGIKAVFRGALMRAKHVGPGVIVAFSGADARLPGVAFSPSNKACGVMSINTGVDDGDVPARTAAWLGAGGPTYTLGAASVFTYTENGGLKTVLTTADDAAAKAAMAEGRLNLVFVQAQAGQTLFFYLIPTRVN